MMSKEERKKLIEKSKEQDRIKKALAEERRLLAAKPIHYVPTDPRLKNLPKKEAVKIIAQYNENIARAEGLMDTLSAPAKTATPKVEAPKEKVDESRKETKKTKKSYYKKKVE